MLFGIAWFVLLPTGQVTLDLSDVQAGELLEGTLTLSLEPEEFLPADTQVVVSLGDIEKTFALYELVSSASVSGTYYASGASLQRILMIKSYFVLNSLSRQFCLNVTQPTELSITQELFKKIGAEHVEYPLKVMLKQRA